MTISLQQPLHQLPPRVRIWAALQRQTANNPRRRRLHAAATTLRAAAQGEDVDSAVKARAWSVVVLQRAFHWFTPRRRQLHSAESCASAAACLRRLPVLCATAAAWLARVPVLCHLALRCRMHVFCLLSVEMPCLRCNTFQSFASVTHSSPLHVASWSVSSQNPPACLPKQLNSGQVHAA